jgi:hypothetical protein
MPGPKLPGLLNFTLYEFLYVAIIIVSCPAFWIKTYFQEIDIY